MTLWLVVSRQDLWGCQRQDANMTGITMESDTLKLFVTPQFAGKVLHQLLSTRHPHALESGPRGTPSLAGVEHVGQAQRQGLLLQQSRTPTGPFTAPLQ